MTIQQVCDWMSATPVSAFISNVSWVIPTLQTVHIVCLSVVVASAGMLNLRLLQVVHHPLSVEHMIRRFTPWIWGMVAVLLVTGVLLTFGEPARELTNQTFWIKMVLVVVGLLTTIGLSLSARRGIDWWSGTPARVTGSRILGAASLAVWAAVVVCGRYIAYTQTS